MRKYYKNKFSQFLNLELKKTGQQRNEDWKKYLYPYHVLQFSLQTFEEELYERFGDQGDLIKLQVAFLLGNFIHPKFMIPACQVSETS